MPTNAPIQYATINDFTPGIITNATGGPLAYLPPGSADATTTGCFASTAGTLIPLPKVQAALEQDFTASAAIWQAATVVPVGLFTCGPMAVSSGANFTQNTTFEDELHFMFQGPTAANHSLQTYEWHTRKLYMPAIPADNITNNLGVGGFIHGVTGITARMRHSSFGNPGLPTFVTEWSEVPFAAGFNDTLMYYPDPATPTSDTVKKVNYGPVQVFNHAGRIILLQNTKYAHGAGNGVFYTNEDIFYTDPPNSDVITSNQATVLDADNCSGFVSWGSLVYGETLLVRRAGGAVVLDGDIYAPQVSVLKGVMSVGDMMNVASPTPTGLVYCVENDGVYLWEGGNSSRKISTIADDFYVRLSNPIQTGVKVKHTRWGRFVAFPNGWLFDTVTNAWWNLDNTANIAMCEAGKGSPNLLFTAPDSFTTPASCPVSVYDLNTLRDSYVWVSQPIKVTEAYNIDVQEVIIDASRSPVGGALITVEIVDHTDAYVTAAVFNLLQTTNSEPRRLRMPCGITSVGSIRVRVTVGATVNTRNAPNLHAISFGWIESAPFPQQGA